MPSESFNWLDPMHSTGHPEIKQEPESSSASLRSTPPSPYLDSRRLPESPHNRPRRRSTLTQKRAKPYPRRDKHREPEDMSHHAYNDWAPNGGDSRGHSEKRSSSEGDHVPPSAYASRSFSNREGARPKSSRSGSSLSGAMGNTHLSSRHSDSDSPPYDNGMQNSMAWSSSHVASHELAGLPSHGAHFPVDSIDAYHPVQYNDFNHAPYQNHSPESISPHSPAFASSTSYTGDEFTYHSTPRSATHRAAASAMLPGPYIPSAGASHHSRPRTTGGDSRDAELATLRRQLAQREQQVIQLETEMSRARSFSAGGPAIILPSSLPPPPKSPAFLASWDARTDARVRMFCSLNRAGNALCAWHDSRRERRVYAPRLAPPGYLNCGCSYDEALFEESLARHSVGSYHPGETVRMDPALRNPLLKLLQTRYGYRDGDFERDPATGEWTEGEGPSYWEAHGNGSSRKSKN